MPEPVAPSRQLAGERPHVVMFGQPAGMNQSVVAAVAAGLAGSRAADLRWICRDSGEAAQWLASAGVAENAVILRAGLSDAEVSSELAAASVGFAPIVDGVSTRRTTVAALLQHGLPVVGISGRATDAVLRDSDAFLFSPGSDGAAALAAIDRLLSDSAARIQMGGAARALFDAQLAWPHIAAAYRRLAS